MTKVLHHFLYRTVIVFALVSWTHAPLFAAGQEEPDPEISVSLRGVADSTVEQGEPVRVVVRLQAPHDAKDAISLSPSSGTWADAIQVEITAAADGSAVVARAEAVGKPDVPNATLDNDHIAGGLWHFSAGEMQRITPGKYVVRARLVMASGSGWTGKVESSAMLFNIVDTSHAPERMTQRAVNLAQDAMLGGRLEEAASVLDAVLKDSPDAVRLLTIRAMVAERAGNMMAALLCANRAERALQPTGNGPPPFELQELKDRLKATMREALNRTGQPAEWTWPPASVMKVPDAILLPDSKTALALPSSNVSLPVSAPIPISAPAPVSPSTATPTQLRPSVAAPAMESKSVPVSVGQSSVGVIVSSAELSDSKIIVDAAGQWAVSAMAGTQYGKTQYSPAQATGAPNISVAGNSPDAWSPENKTGATDWLEVGFAKPVHATEVRVRQNDSVGAIAKIEAIEPDGTSHVWWEGVDPYKPTAVREIVWFAVRVPQTSYLVAKAKITLNLSATPGWKEIDAVQLVSVSAH